MLTRSMHRKQIKEETPYITPTLFYNLLANNDAILDVLREMKLLPRSGFLRFIMDQGNLFEALVYQTLQDRFPGFLNLHAKPWEVYKESGAIKTYQALRDNVPILAQAVLRDPKTRTCGIADLIVRHDYLPKVMEGLEMPPPGYYIVDIKYTSIKLLKSGKMSDEGSQRAYKAQIYLYTRILSEMLETEMVDRAYLMGRKAGLERNCFQTVTPVFWKDEPKLPAIVEGAISWTRLVRKNYEARYKDLCAGRIPHPLLRPNLCNPEATEFKLELARKIGDPTMFHRLGPEHRKKLDAEGITMYHRNALKVLGLSPKTHRVVERQLADADLLPARGSELEFAVPRPLKAIAVDFESLNEIFDDFKTFPVAPSTCYITMIGVADRDPEGQIRFKSFVLESLSPEAEFRMLEAFLAYVADLDATHLMHWGHAEASLWKAVQNRHPNLSAHRWMWYDLGKVYLDNAIVPRGALGFGLKSISKALGDLGEIPRLWDRDVCTDGQDAMVLFYKAHQDGTFHDSPILQEIIRYNEDDCRAVIYAFEFLMKTYKIRAI